MVIWTLVTWIFTPTLTKLVGLYGFPITQLLLASSSIFVIRQAKKVIEFNFMQSVYVSLTAATAMGICVYFLLTVLHLSVLSVGIAILTGAVVYYGIVQFVFKVNVITTVKQLFAHE